MSFIMKDFRKLNVWEKAHSLVIEIYRVTNNFPKSETFGLTSQIRRASASIPANIAEGCGRDGEADFARFLQMALGSSSELEYHLLLAHDLNMLDETFYDNLKDRVIELKRMLTSLIQKLRADS
jgi:four helix bundle protein